MRKLIFTIIIVSLFISCKKIMHEEQLSIGKIDSKEKLIDATNALYGMIGRLTAPTTQNFKSDDLSFYFPNYRYYEDKSFCVIKDQSPYTESNNETYWEKEYLIIADENNIILQYNSFKNDNESDHIFGEIYLLRAYIYYLLTQKYGRVPIIDDLDINYTQRLASIDDIYKYIEADLKKAIQLLPKNNSSARVPYVTPCRGTAKAILAELYLSWAGYPLKDKQKYTDAARESGEIIDSAAYFGYELLPDFADLWRRKQLFNKESIFSFYCDNYLEIKNYWDDLKFYSERTNYASEINFYNNFPVGYRKELTFLTCTTIYKYVFDSIAYNYFISDSTVLHFDKVDPCARIAYRKFFIDTSVIHHYDYNDTAYFNHTGKYWDWQEIYGIGRNYLLRYAQTLLTYSEAVARMGQLNDKAYEYVNMIRRRARNLPLTAPSVYDLPKGLSPEAFADSVVWERAWELCAENNVRWNDVRRLELVEKFPEMRNELEGGPPLRFDKSVYFEPIPVGDLRLNPNLKY